MARMACAPRRPDVQETPSHAPPESPGRLAEACVALHASGQYRACIGRARAVLAQRAPARCHAEAFAISCAAGAASLAELGDPRGALDMIADEQEHAAGDAPALLVLATAVGDVLVTAGRAADALRPLEQTVDDVRQRGEARALVRALRHLGRALLDAGRPEDAVRALEESIALEATAEPEAPRALGHLTLARAFLRTGDLTRAEAALDTALDLAARFEERGLQARARLAAAHLARERGARKDAEASLDEAQDLADELAMMPLMERCRAFARTLR
jgi:tetratricopeptide (TPR) repeat protein